MQGVTQVDLRLPFIVARHGIGPQVKHLLLPILLLTAIYCQAAPILAEEAKNLVGETVSVHGVVEQVSVSKMGHAFLNFRLQIPSAGLHGLRSGAVTPAGYKRICDECPDVGYLTVQKKGRGARIRYLSVA